MPRPMAMMEMEPVCAAPRPSGSAGGWPRWRAWYAWCVLVLGGVLGLAGCVTTPTTSGPSPTLPQAYEAYQRSDYETSYALGAQLAADHSSGGGVGGSQALEAAYIAGMSAYQLDRPEQAQYYLSYAAASRDAALAADAKAGLGLAYLQLGRYPQAETTLLDAAARLHGQDRANAYYYAGMAQQRQGQWVQARDHFAAARASSTDPAFIQQCADMMRSSGFTLQLGAFAKLANARALAQSLRPRSAAAGLGEPRILTAADGKGQRLYLVQCGRFTTQAAAQAAQSRPGLSKSVIVAAPWP